jgi:hypothetical protein
MGDVRDDGTVPVTKGLAEIFQLCNDKYCQHHTQRYGATRDLKIVTDTEIGKYIFHLRRIEVAPGNMGQPARLT